MRAAYLTEFLPWGISLVTLAQSWMAGNKHPRAWLVSMGSQALWAVWIVAAQAWGFVPLHLALWVIYARNHRRWRET